MNKDSTLHTPRYTAPLDACEQELIYKTVGEKQLHLLFFPPTNKVFDRAPVYFIIPGGGWCESSASAMAGFSRRSSDDLRARGWATVSIDYRVCPSDGIWMDEIISDCMDAARYLRHFEDVLGIDANRIVTSGHSAGGHLALMLALAPHCGFTADSPFDATADDFRVLACAPLSPPTVLYKDAGGYNPMGFALGHLFREGDTDFAAQHRGSPIDYVTPLSVPLLLCCGTHDALVTCENSVWLYERCRALGAPCEILYSHFGGHCFESMVEGKASCLDFNEMQDRVRDFVIPFGA